MNRIGKRLSETASKQEEIDKFTKFYNECDPGTYLRMILDNAHINPTSVEDAIRSDNGFI